MPVSPISAPPWHRADIVAAVWKTGTSLRALSIENGYAPSTLRASLERLHPRAHQIIAARIGVPRNLIWPQFYDQRGERLRLSAFERRASSSKAA
jgi:Ner family transcriptional regulator